MHVEIRRQGHLTNLQSASVGYAVETVAYVAGALLIGSGLYLAIRGSIPGWWARRFLWPVVRVTPTVARLQGWAALGAGASILAIVFTTVVSERVGWILVLAAIVAYLVAVLLFLFSTWLSRRPTG